MPGKRELQKLVLLRAALATAERAYRLAERDYQEYAIALAEDIAKERGGDVSPLCWVVDSQVISIRYGGQARDPFNVVQIGDINDG